MQVNDIIHFLENIAPPFLQEPYDNAGLITGNKSMACTGAIICLDCTEEIVQEAIEKKCNLIIAHHPIIFNGLKKINGNNYVERTIIKAIKNNMAIYAIHTNLDNVIEGVNGKIAEKIGLQKLQVLAPKPNNLQKLVVFCPPEHATNITNALHSAGAGNIGNYSHCSFTSTGMGSFTPAEGANPQTGKIGKNEKLTENKIEVIFPTWLQAQVLQAMKANHPYEEVAYDIYNMANNYQNIGSGVVGYLPEAMNELDLLGKLAKLFGTQAIRHTQILGKRVQKIALCGGAGSFLINAAKAAAADVYITSDLKYHEFFEADNQLTLIDVGHYESEQFTIELLFDLLSNKFPTFALQKTSNNTNPVRYFAL